MKYVSIGKKMGVVYKLRTNFVAISIRRNDERDAAQSGRICRLLDGKIQLLS